MRLAPAAALALCVAACGRSGPAGPDARVILADEPAAMLSDYGLFADVSAREPAEGVVAYDLVNPLFSDHASKHRLAYVPGGEAAAYDPQRVFDFPVGSVLVKTFAFAPDMRQPAENERYIETRLLIRKAEGWVAYPYVWNEAQTEATYAPVGARRQIETISPDGQPLSIAYAVPNRNQCKTCHSTGDVLEPIGPKARNLNHDGPAGVNQIADWTARGMLADAPDAGAVTAIPAAFDASAPIGDRARAWLDINCAHCHKAEGSASNSGLFLDWHETDPTGWGVHKRPVAAGRGAGQNLFVIEPGAPDQSILVHRIDSVEPGVMMPELGRTVVDERGLKLVRDWIAGMAPAAPDRQREVVMTYEGELRKALATSPVPGWRALRADGLHQYSDKNVAAVERVFEDLIFGLSRLGPDAAESLKVGAFERAVLDLNKLNDRTGGSLIETGEREQLAELINTISQAAGLDPSAYGHGEGLASEWRDW